MKKTNILWIILNSIFLIVFNAIFFTLGDVGEYNASVWISYGFIHFAYLFLLLTPVLIRKGKSSAVFGFSIYSISSFYFLIEFFIGIIFILISLENFKTAFVVQLCISGFYGVLLVSNMIANEHTADAEEKRRHQIAYVKDASAKVKKLLESVDDKEMKKKIERLYDVLYSSPVKSHPDLAQVENSILLSIYSLENAVSSGDRQSIISFAESLFSAASERNSRLKRLV